MKPNVVNFHVTDRCNYQCKYCFAKFKKPDPSFDEAKRVVDEIKGYFLKHGIQNGRINIAGGEPTVYPHIEELIRYIHGQGIKCSIITNGSRLTEDFCIRTSGMLDMIGISIDAETEEGNVRVGRCNSKGTPDFERLERASAIMHKHGIRLKINTVVSKLNLNEDLNSVYRRLKPDKIKLFCMHVVDNINGNARELVVERAIEMGCEMVQFVKGHFTKEKIELAHAHGIRCNVFWSDDPAEAKEFLDMGIDTILTNDYLAISRIVEEYK